MTPILFAVIVFQLLVFSVVCFLSSIKSSSIIIIIINIINIIHEFHLDADLEQNFRTAVCHVLH